MNPNDGIEITADAARARDALRAAAPPRPDSGYRARVRAAFVAGALEPPRPRVVPLARRPWVRWAAIPAAAAAAVLVVAALNRAPAWDVTAVRGSGVALVDGRPLPLERVEELRERLRAGTRIVVPEGAEVEIASAGRMVIAITPGSEAVVPAAPGRWFGRAIRGALATGELRITTGRGFEGARLTVRTPEAEVLVTGTTLAVIRESHGTCVCVLEGRVMVGPDASELHGIEPGRRRFVFNDGRPMEEAPMRDMERDKLGMFRESHAGRMAAR